MQLPAETKFPGKTLKKGDAGTAVKIVQEWLCLHGHAVVIDGEFGPATASALARFAPESGIPMSAAPVVDQKVWSALWEPLRHAVQPTPGCLALPPGGNMTVRVAGIHLEQHPREVGGQNRGPWVRLYMLGREGEQWAWCAGFVTYILKQASEYTQKPMLIDGGFSCTQLAQQAAKKKALIREGQLGAARQIKPGDVFLVPKQRGAYQHTGLVAAVDVRRGIVLTIEGNTNDDGSREGYEVCERTRAIKSLAFIRIG